MRLLAALRRPFESLCLRKKKKPLPLSRRRIRKLTIIIYADEVTCGDERNPIWNLRFKCLNTPSNWIQNLLSVWPELDMSTEFSTTGMEESSNGLTRGWRLVERRLPRCRIFRRHWPLAQ